MLVEMALKQIVWVDVSHLSTILRHSSNSLLLFSLLFWIFSLHAWNLLWEYIIEYFFFWELRLPGDCISAWICPFSPREREAARCVRSRRPVFLSKGKATNVTQGARGRMYTCSYRRALMELVLWESEYKTPGRIKFVGSAWRVFRSCKQVPWSILLSFGKFKYTGQGGCWLCRKALGRFFL